MAMFDPPPGYDDMLGDAEQAHQRSGFVELDVDGVGVVLARYPLPNAIPNLAMAANAKIPSSQQVRHMMRFVRAHVEDVDGVLDAMMEDRLPADSVERIARAVATWGTARPTSPSSFSL